MVSGLAGGQDTYLINNNDQVIDAGLDGLVSVSGPRVNINNIQVAEGGNSVEFVRVSIAA